MTSTLSPSTSKLLYELIGHSDTTFTYDEEGLGLHESDDACKRNCCIPLPNLAELIRLLPKIGEKRNWLMEPTCFVVPGLLKFEDVLLVIIAKYINAKTEPEAMSAVDEYLRKILA